jgi:hypothetical protein
MRSCSVSSLIEHDVGKELRVFLGPEEKNDLLWSELAQFDFTPLEEKAADLRSVLLEKGWTELTSND